MADKSTVKVTYLGDASQLARASRQAQGSIDGVGKKAKQGGGAMAGLGKSFIAAGAVIGAVGVFKSFIAEAEESRRISRLTAAAIKSTGGAAKITAAQVGDLATSISNKTGIDDEAIQSASNLLLTFTKVRNEVGKGNDIFNQATKAAVDMSVVMGTDARTASMQLGKALNDPVKGVTALSKAGVSFTQQQKDQIKAMVKAGDTLGAQKVILKEMQVQFGGAAEAAATPMEKLKVTVGNLKERIGGALLPVIDRFANFVLNRVVPGIERLVKQFKNGEGTGGKLRETFEKMRATFERNRPQLEALAQALAKVGAFILTKVIPVVVSLYVNHIARLVDAFKMVGTVMKGIIGVVLNVFGAIINGAAKAFGWVPGLGGKLKGAAKEFNRFKDSVNATLDGINDKKVRVTAEVFYSQKGRGGRADIKGFAKGTRSAPPGMAWTGEEGPELVEFEGGERVHTAPESRRMMRGGSSRGAAGGGDTMVQVNLHLDGQKILTSLQRIKRVEGRALGLA